MAFIEGDGWSADILDWGEVQEGDLEHATQIIVEVSIADAQGFVITLHSIDGFTDDELESVILDAIEAGGSP